VIDTNVVLDLLLFRDGRCATLADALAANRIRAVTDAACFYEWPDVLARPLLSVEADRRAGLIAAYEALTERLAAADADDASDAAAQLPRCKDPDDQKFLELALRADARWLVTKDKLLLKLDRRLRKTGRFRVLTPQLWTQAWNDTWSGAAADANRPELGAEPAGQA